MPKIKNKMKIITQTNFVKRRKSPGKFKIKKQSPKINITNLPKEILEKCFSNINVWHWKGIRGTNKKFRDVCDSLITHKFRVLLNKSKNREIRKYQYFALQGLHLATWVYLKFGFDGKFAGSVLPCLRSSHNYRNCFCPSTLDIQEILLHFYCSIYDEMKSSHLEEFNHMYMTTLLSLLHNCENSKIVSTNNIELENWKIVYELKGAWFGIIFSNSKRDTIDFLSNNPFMLLVILTELLIGYNSKNVFTKFWNNQDLLYVYGCDLSDRIRCPKLTFIFDIFGTNENLQAFRNSSIDENSIPLQHGISMNLKINSTEAFKWGCPGLYYLNI